MTDPPVYVSSPPQNGRLPCDADIDRLTLNEGYINGAHHVGGFEARNYPCCCTRGANSKQVAKLDDLILLCPCLQFRMEPGQVMEESYTVEEEPQELPPVVSVETSEDGTTRRTETTVPKTD